MSKPQKYKNKDNENLRRVRQAQLVAIKKYNRMWNKLITETNKTSLFPRKFLKPT